MASRIPLESRLAAFIEERAGDRTGALPLHAGGNETLGIRPDGSLVRWTPGSDEMLPIESPIDAAIALLLGAQRYSPLRPLLPVRPDGVADCVTCGGAGQIAGAPEFICECGGLGWWPRSLADLGVVTD